MFSGAVDLVPKFAAIGDFYTSHLRNISLYSNRAAEVIFDRKLNVMLSATIITRN